MTRGPSVTDDHLSLGLDYPTDREKLLRKARENGASDDVLRMLQAMPSQDYGSMADILERYEAP